MADTANLQIKVTSTGVKKASDDLENLSKSAMRADKRTKQASSAIGGMGRSAGQAGIQIQQFVGQIQGGQSAMLALSQQGADLGFVLGAPLVGAIVGIGASLLGIFAPALFGASEKVEELTDKLKELANVQGLTKEQVAVLVQEEQKEIALRKEKIASLNLELEANQAQLKNQQQVINNYDKESKTFKNLERARDAALQKSNEIIAARQLEQQGIDDSNEKISRYNLLVGGEGLEVQDKFKTSTMGVVNSLENQIVALRDGESAAIAWRTAQSLGLSSADELPEEIKKRIDLINQLRDAQAEQAEEQKRLNTLESITQSLNAQAIALEQGAQAAFEFQVAQRLGLESGEQIPEQLQAQIDKIYALKEAQGELKTTQEELKLSAEEMYQAIGENAVQGLGDATATALVEMKSLGDGLKSVLQGVLKQAISTLVQLGIQELLFAQTKATAKGIETAAAVAQGAAIATAMTPAAAATTIATGGANLASANALLPTFGSIFAATMATTASAGGIGARQSGGSLQGGQSSYIAENGIEIFTPNKAGRVFNSDEVAEMIRGGGNKTSSATINVYPQENIDNWLDNGGIDKIKRKLNQAELL